MVKCGEVNNILHKRRYGGSSPSKSYGRFSQDNEGALILGLGTVPASLAAAAVVDAGDM
jgi:hypothetical protein